MIDDLFSFLGALVISGVVVVLMENQRKMFDISTLVCSALQDPLVQGQMVLDTVVQLHED